MMLRVLCFSCTFSLLGLPVTMLGATAALTEEAVYQLADDVAKASEAKDVQGVLRNMSKSVSIEINKRGKAPTKLDYLSYHARLSKSFPLLSYYRYTRSNEAVTIHDDGQSALLRFDLEERYVVNGKYNKERHAQEWLVVLKDGAPRVERVVIE